MGISTATSPQGNLAGAPARIPELDALRAFAVFAVLFHHYFRGYAPTFGWMGVDFFFVLSGYFITTILLAARGERNYYLRFYMRRALRILPLYYIRSQLDEKVYEAGIKVSDEELAKLAIERDPFHGGWNYRFSPRAESSDV